MEPLIWAYICAKEKKETIDKFGYQEGYNTAALEWRVFLKRLARLRTEKNMSIVLIAHNQQRKVDDPEYGQLDRHDLKLHPKSAGVVAEVVDCVFFAKHKINVRKEEKVLEPRATEASIPGTSARYNWRTTLPGKEQIQLAKRIKS